MHIDVNYGRIVQQGNGCKNYNRKVGEKNFFFGKRRISLNSYEYFKNRAQGIDGR